MNISNISSFAKATAILEQAATDVVQARQRHETAKQELRTVCLAASDMLKADGPQGRPLYARDLQGLRCCGGKTEGGTGSAEC